MTSKILVIDDHEIIHEGIVSLLNKFHPEFEVHGISDINLVDERLSNVRYSLIILDVNLPNGSALSIVESVTEKKMGIPILVFSALEEKILAQSFFKMGAMGYIQKSESWKEVLKAVETVLAGNKYISSAMKDLFMNKSMDLAFSKKKNELTLSAKEVEILNLVRNGKKIKEISEILETSISNIYLHRKNIFKKLNVKDDMELTRALEKLL